MKKILLHAALGLIAVVSLIPLVWMVSASLMPSGEASEFPPPFFPSKPTFVHYGELFSRLSLLSTLRASPSGVLRFAAPLRVTGAKTAGGAPSELI